jgi:hypothetical protein
MKLPSNPLSGGSVVAKITEIISFIRASRITSVIGGQIRETPNGSVLVIKPGRGGAASAVPEECSFGEITTNTEDPPVTSIRGGLMVCGDKNFNVLKYDLDMETDGEWLVEINLTGVTAAIDDDSEVFLPGCTTATGTPAWDLIEFTGAEEYTDTTNPTSPAAPTGTLIVGLGMLDITDGIATFTPTGCGTITVGQCAGILNHTRA